MTSTSNCGSAKKTWPSLESLKWLHNNHGFLKTMASWFAISLKNVHVHQKGKTNQGNFTSMAIDLVIYMVNIWLFIWL